MLKDIRDILKEAEANSKELRKDHRARFEKRLKQLHQPKKKQSFFFLKIAASMVLLLSISYFTFNTDSTEVIEPADESQTENVGLSNISPEMKLIEDYYVTAINYEMASLEITEDNQAILDEYLDKIGKLTEDYKRLNNEYIKNGINEKTVNALITNLQLRLQILLQLKDKLNEIKTTKNIENEDATI